MLVTIQANRMEFEIVGREEELASLREFLEEPRGHPSAFAIDGEPGIGKSVLWSACVAYARERGISVLAAQPAEAERGLGYVGLIDLLDPVADEQVLSRLTPPRRHAVERALLREPFSTGRVDHRALAVGVRDVLADLGAVDPVLIAIDDVQWLDASSARVLTFALRRLDADVRLLTARRAVGGLQRTQGELGVERARCLEIGSLSPGALHRLLRARLERSFPRQSLLRIHARSGGNPFFALELARLLEADANPLEPLVVPNTLEQLLQERLRGLAKIAREAADLASALGTASESMLVRAGTNGRAVDAAVAAGVLQRSDGVIRFTHPLLASVIYDDLGPSKAKIHERIAKAVDDPLMRARHIALSTSEPDEVVARELTAAASLAADRSAFATAAELGEQAMRLTPPGQDAALRARSLAAARAHQAAGEWPRARTLASNLVATGERGPSRVEALVLLSDIEAPDPAARLLTQALAECDPGTQLQADVLCRLAWALRFADGAEHARQAVEIAEQLDDDVLRPRARAVQTILSWFAGSPVALDLAAQARDFAAAVGGDHLVQEATLAFVNTNAPTAHRKATRAVLEREHLEWRERDELRAALALWGLSWIEFWAGRWELAAAHAAGAHDISVQYGLERPQGHLPIAVIAAHRGLLDLARDHSERALVLAEVSIGVHPPQHLATIGLVSLWEGDQPGGLDWLARATRQAGEFGWGEPSLRWWTGDYVELLLASDQADEAERVLETWQADAQRVGRAWVLAHVTRCRGLLAAAEGDIEGGTALLQQAVEEHQAVGDPYGRARALLAFGVVSRRARLKRGAREAIEAADAAFTQLGASYWAGVAREELGRVGGRRRTAGLTAAEQRVARLVVEGKTNREVAATLFLGERTVASHLTHIYAKLGVRSRTELASKLQTF
jgi:DNA-binding CsgD family transcriptional regulator